MSNQLLLQQFQVQLLESISSNQFVKISLGDYQGNDKELKNIYVRRVMVKRTDMLSFTYRYKTRDIFKNFPISEGIAIVSHLLSNDFKFCTLFTLANEITVEHNKKGSITLREKLSEIKSLPNLTHDKQKKRIIESTGKQYLQDLQITDHEGKVIKNAQDKFKQINRYIELLSPMISELGAGSIKNVVDMGSGKGYLTFALYDYLHQVLGLETSITGVEYREDLVELCNGIAHRSNFTGLNFIQGTIEDYQVCDIDLLIALHACDTATDDAIYKGVKANAQLIVVAPCCHKQIRKEMEKARNNNDLSFLIKYGIFMERQAEMVTDGIRALILEYCGYKTKVFEFISSVHTPKNVMIVAIKNKISEARKQELMKQIQDAKAYFGIEYHYLEKLFND